MPDRADIVARNRAITARYASWYLAEPRLKWAAMAALTSSGMGELFALFREGSAPGLQRPMTLLFGGTFELLRETNFAVFDDIGWAHHAFLESGGDWRAVAEELDGLESHRDVVRGFEAISGAAEEDDEAASRAVWEGARLILRHEQVLTVQPRFERMNALSRAYFTASAVTPYSCLSSRPVRASRFIAFALGQLAKAPPSLPDVTKLEQRWPWIERECLAIFREVESRGDPQMRAYMEALAAGRSP